MVEHWSPKPGAVGSNPATPAKPPLGGFFMLIFIECYPNSMTLNLMLYAKHNIIFRCYPDSIKIYIKKRLSPLDYSFISFASTDIAHSILFFSISQRISYGSLIVPFE